MAPPQEQPQTQPPPTSPSTSTPIPPPSSSNSADLTSLAHHGTPAILHNAAIAAVILGPIALLLPGRGRGAWSVQNTIISGGTFWAANQLAYDFSGKSIVARSNERWSKMMAPILTEGHLPEKARETKRLMELERARREAALPAEQRALVEDARKAREEMRERQDKGVLGKIWMGGEEEGWKERRLREEKEALESGKGYGDLIMEQIWDVWNQKGKEKGGKKAGEEGDKEEEKKDKP
ncbi:hypothetical protein B0T17DRAFT_503042 [Bombardia bombarda]|uniref:Rhomboid family membrane protein n=1 Tax=Bombardia bombarda TaxID=252184 RepID=A0AA39XLJ9_9PEZI|nr:hypothetical protein B0T17DRAFT_503042 [Bombardia bombarda]